jgi:hypothetical protein
VDGNFVINQNTIPPTISTQLGYQAPASTSSTNISTTFSALVSVTSIPKGIWIVEGVMRTTFSGSGTYTFSLSETAGFDLNRSITRIISAAGACTDRITTVFLLSAPTIIHLYGQLGTTSASSSSNSITYTRIG